MASDLALEGTGLELILNAADGSLQICVTCDEKPLAFQEWFEPCKGAETLAWAIEGICRRAGFEAREFRRIACVAGPGSFTGIRVTLATAAALRRASQAMLGSLDYMQALATSAAVNLYLLYGRKIWALTHARRDLVHARAYVSFGPLIPAQPAGELMLLEPAKARALLENEDCFVCGGALMHHPRIVEASWAAFAAASGPRYLPTINRPSPEALRLLARHADYFDEDITPLYARDCDAIDNLPRIAEKMGADPALAVSRLQSLLKREPAPDAIGK